MHNCFFISGFPTFHFSILTFSFFQISFFKYLIYFSTTMRYFRLSNVCLALSFPVLTFGYFLNTFWTQVFFPHFSFCCFYLLYVAILAIAKLIWLVFRLIQFSHLYFQLLLLFLANCGSFLFFIVCFFFFWTVSGLIGDKLWHFVLIRKSLSKNCSVNYRNQLGLCGIDLQKI